MKLSFEDSILLSPGDFEEYNPDKKLEFELSLRPKNPNIIQVQSEGLDQYSVWRHPNIMEEFEHYAIAHQYLMRTINDEILTDRLISMAISFGLANLELDSGRIYRVEEYGILRSM